MEIFDALRDLVLFVQFKKREKHTWVVLLSILKVVLLRGFFLGFLNSTNGAKLCKASHIELCYREESCCLKLLFCLHYFVMEYEV